MIKTQRYSRESSLHKLAAEQQQMSQYLLQQQQNLANLKNGGISPIRDMKHIGAKSPIN